MDYFKYMALAFQIAQEISAAQVNLASGQPVTLPEIRTYIAKKHVALDLTIKPL